jgi:alpha/beta superfamily hydrolase
MAAIGTRTERRRRSPFQQGHSFTVRRTPGIAEHRLFLAAAALIALHVVLDSFVVLEPGAARIDHAAGAGIALGVLVASAACYRRLRPGARACIALVVGGLSLVSGVLAAVEAIERGPEATSWTAILVIVAGSALCALGVWLLWTGRRRDGRRYLRRALITVGAVVVAYWLLYPAAMALVVTQKPRAEPAPADLGRPYEDVTLRTADGLELAGWYVPSLNGAAVIAFPGRSGPVPHARMLANHGYGVLLLDMRGQGESDGDPNAFGWGSSKDLDAAVAFLQDRPDVGGGRIGGLGLSVGGELLLEAAAGHPALRAVVAEGAGWRSVRESFTREGPSQLELWLQAPTDAVLTAATVVLSGTAPPPALDELVAEIAPRPVYLVYGEHGDGGERALTPAYYDAAGLPKMLWEVPGARHTGGLDAQPQEYERRVVGFFDATLLAPSAEPAG